MEAQRRAHVNAQFDQWTGAGAAGPSIQWVGESTNYRVGRRTRSNRNRLVSGRSMDGWMAGLKGRTVEEKNEM